MINTNIIMFTGIYVILEANSSCIPSSIFRLTIACVEFLCTKTHTPEELDVFANKSCSVKLAQYLINGGQELLVERGWSVLPLVT